MKQVFCFPEQQEYVAYQKQAMMDLTPSKKEELEILSLLESLGYPMNELGTYLYKNMIISILKTLRTISQPIELQSLKEELNDAYSQFYFDIARNDLDMGVSTFHACIQKAISEIDPKKVNLSLEQEIKKEKQSYSYAENAYLIGIYFMNQKQEKELDHPMIKKLVKLGEQEKVSE